MARFSMHHAGLTIDWQRCFAATAVAAGLLMIAAPAFPAKALSIELKDVAPDRVERQRAAATGSLPLAGTPDVVRWQERLQEKGVKVGAPILIRAFKAESAVEVWMQKGETYTLFATYPVCHWSGSLGPKLREGDKQTPEGFYTVARRQIYHVGRWPRSLDLDFPNIFDQSQARTGSSILIHGGCSSVGCFAMTNPVMEEIYDLTKSALAAGQKFVPVHVFPFRMTAENMERAKDNPWTGFWVNLKEGYDAFERTHLPPKVSVCDNRYLFDPNVDIKNPAAGINACEPTIAEIKAQQDWLKQLPRPQMLQALRAQRGTVAGLALSRTLPGMQPPARLGGPATRQALLPAPPVRCSLSRASCRKYVGVRQRQTARRTKRTRSARR